MEDIHAHCEKDEETGQVLDSIYYVPVPSERVIVLREGNGAWCTDILVLLKNMLLFGKTINPFTRSQLSPDVLRKIDEYRLTQLRIIVTVHEYHGRVLPVTYMMDSIHAVGDVIATVLHPYGVDSLSMLTPMVDGKSLYDNDLESEIVDFGPLTMLRLVAGNVPKEDQDRIREFISKHDRHRGYGIDMVSDVPPVIDNEAEPESMDDADIDSVLDFLGSLSTRTDTEWDALYTILDRYSYSVVVDGLSDLDDGVIYRYTMNKHRVGGLAISNLDYLGSSQGYRGYGFVDLLASIFNDMIDNRSTLDAIEDMLAIAFKIPANGQRFPFQKVLDYGDEDLTKDVMERSFALTTNVQSEYNLMVDWLAHPGHSPFNVAKTLSESIDDYNMAVANALPQIAHYSNDEQFNTTLVEALLSYSSIQGVLSNCRDVWEGDELAECVRLIDRYLISAEERR